TLAFFDNRPHLTDESKAALRIDERKEVKAEVISWSQEVYRVERYGFFHRSQRVILPSNRLRIASFDEAIDPYHMPPLVERISKDFGRGHVELFEQSTVFGSCLRSVLSTKNPLEPRLVVGELEPLYLLGKLVAIFGRRRPE